MKYKNGEAKEIVHAYFCGECNQETQGATIRRNPESAKRKGFPSVEIVARACMNSQEHKHGKNYLWAVGETYMPKFEIQ